MPKKLHTEVKMMVEIVCSDGKVISERCSCQSANSIFRSFVIDCIGRHSLIREINLYDSANRIYKSYKQYY